MALPASSREGPFLEGFGRFNRGDRPNTRGVKIFPALGLLSAILLLGKAKGPRPTLEPAAAQAD